MPRAAVNTLANFAGSAISQVTNIGFAIVYFRVLGSESYGLIGFLVTLLQLGNYIADMGIGRVVVRELARRSHAPDSADEIRDVVFTLQFVSVALSICIGISTALGADWLAKHWLVLENTPQRSASQAIMLMAAIAVLQIPRSISLEALRGLQEQVLSNVLVSSFSIGRGLVTVFALSFVSATVTMYLSTQIAVSLMETCAITGIAWLRLPKGSRLPRLGLAIIRKTWAFAAADGAATIIGALTFLGDRVLLSRLLPLDSFGSYVFCTSVADSLGRLSGPFTNAFYPHFVALIARKNEEQLSRDYLLVTRVVSALVVSGALVIAFYSKDIIVLLLRNPEISASFAIVMALRSIANMFNSFLQMPHVLQLATGLSSLWLKVNVASICIYLPCIQFLTPRFGIVTPAALWLVVNVLYIFPMTLGTHNRVLKKDMWKWCYGSVIEPILIVTAIVGGSKLLAPHFVTWFVTIPWLGMTAALSAAAVVLSSVRTRGLAFSGLRIMLRVIRNWMTWAASRLRAV
jgi:O-antigen/teichoic acid export membrane protein